MNITFTNISDNDILPKPVLAKTMIPDWYKELESYKDNKKKPVNALTSGTIKRCMPVFDVMTAGYLLLTPCDIYVTPTEEGPYFEWAFGADVITFHSIDQVKGYPGVTIENAAPKFNNRWAIKTPSGYSTLFIPPVHRDAPFSILSGVIDTDKYFVPGAFPFFMKDPNWEGLIPQGTPYAQLIPFKRDSWTMKFGGEKEMVEQANQAKAIFSKFFDRYKTMFRSNKEYK